MFKNLKASYNAYKKVVTARSNFAKEGGIPALLINDIFIDIDDVTSVATYNPNYVAVCGGIGAVTIFGTSQVRNMYQAKIFYDDLLLNAPVNIQIAVLCHEMGHVHDVYCGGYEFDTPKSALDKTNLLKHELIADRYAGDIVGEHVVLQMLRWLCTKLDGAATKSAMVLIQKRIDETNALLHKEVNNTPHRVAMQSITNVTHIIPNCVQSFSSPI